MAFDPLEEESAYASPGFASGTSATSLSLPPVSADPADGGLGGPMADGSQGDFSLPNSGFNLESAGLNLAKPRTRSQDESDYLQNLPTGQKIGLALQAFSAGVAGRPDPIDTLLKNRRAKETADRADLTNTIGVIQKGTEILRKMPPGIARDAVAAELGKAVGGGPIAEVFKAAGDQHTEIKEVLATFTDPDVQGQLVKACSGSADFRACVMTQARDKDFMDRAHAMADSKRMGTVITKLAAAIDQAKKTGIIEQFKDADGKYEVPFAKLIELNDKAKIFTPEEMDTIRRNEDMLSPFGIKTTAAIKTGAAEKAKQAEKPAKEWSDPYTLNGVLVQKNLTTNEIRTAVSRPPREPSEDLTAAQKMKQRREAAAYDNAQEMMKKFNIGPDGASTDPKVQERLTPTITTRLGSDKNPKFDPQFAGRVKAWTRLTEAGDPREREGVEPAAAPKAEPKPAPKDEPKAAPAADKPAAKGALSAADRKAVVDAATAAVNGGADPEAVKKRLKERYDIDVTFSRAAKK